MNEQKKMIPWDDEPVDITAEANFIWGIANKLRGSYMPDKYGDVIIPMTIIRRFECALEATKAAVVTKFQENPNFPAKALQRISGYQFYNTSEFTLRELCNDPDHIAANFRAYLNGFSANVQDIVRELNMDDHIKKMDQQTAARIAAEQPPWHHTRQCCWPTVFLRRYPCLPAWHRWLCAL